MAALPSASPRPSLSLLSPPSSRTSLDFSPQPPSTSRPAINPSLRRTRTALRDYYGLKNSSGDPSSSAADSRGSSIDTAQRDRVVSPTAGGVPRAFPVDSRLDALDREGFDAGAYVRNLLEKDSLKALLRTENELVAEVRGLDGERKALVYDNYSKLISATDTIKKMRSNMDPLSPATSTLAPAIAHIAETAAGLANELASQTQPPKDVAQVKRERDVQTVQWVLGAPERLRGMARQNKRDEMEKEWSSIKKILDRWKDVQGVSEVRLACENVLETSTVR